MDPEEGVKMLEDAILDVLLASLALAVIGGIVGCLM